MTLPSHGDESSPLVTVVIPTLDRPTALHVALTSVLAQRDVNLEAIVVDDGSAPPVADTLAGRGDPRVRIIRHDQPRGMSAARNAGLRARRGQWVAFCDDDDLWAPDKLRAQLDAAGDRDWAYCGVVHVDAGLRIIATPPTPDPQALVADLLHWDAVPAGASNVVVRAALLDRVGGFNEDYRHMADWDLWLRLAAQGPPACTADALLAYRVHAGAMSLEGPGLFAEINLLERNTDARVDRPSFLRWIASRHLAAGRGLTAFTWLVRAAWSSRGHGLLGDLRMLAAGVRARLGARPPTDINAATAAESWIAPLRAQEVAWLQR